MIHTSCTLCRTPGTQTIVSSVLNLDQFKNSPVDPSYPEWIRTFYSPLDDVHEVLKALIDNTKQSLIISMFGYDDDELAQIVASKIDNPNIYCQITLDKSQSGGVHEKALLEKYKAEMSSNSVAVGTSEKGAIIHRKMVVIDGLWRISGSTNWSLSGETKQDNELTVINNATVAAEARHAMDLAHLKVRRQMNK